MTLPTKSTVYKQATLIIKLPNPLVLKKCMVKLSNYFFWGANCGRGVPGIL